MLLNDYKLEVIWQEGCCGQWQSAIASLSEDIGHALPQLASAINDGSYDPAEDILRLVKDSKYIYVYPDRIHILCVSDENEACTLVEWAKDTINRAYSEARKVMESREPK